MKLKLKLKLMIIIIAALAALSGAMVWEGAAAVAPAGALPDSGLYAAANSFPLNTALDITNLDNGKTVRVLVFAGLETPGFLAMLSRDAAAVIGLSSGSIGRIRMGQPVDPVAPSGAASGTYAAPGYAPEVIIDLPDYVPPALSAYSPPERSYTIPPEYIIPGVSQREGPVAYQPPPESAIDRSQLIPPLDYFVQEVPPARPMPEAVIDESKLIAPPRAPAKKPEAAIDESQLIAPPERVVKGTAPAKPDPEPCRGDAEIAGTVYTPEYSADLTGEVFHTSAPANTEDTALSRLLIKDLAQGKFYVQLLTLPSEELVKSEIAKIDPSYPLVVQYPGDNEKPAYRILLGPLNQGESGAMLQRSRRMGYTDAVIVPFPIPRH